MTEEKVEQFIREVEELNREEKEEQASDWDE